jgi:hypothetical protein
MKEAEYFQKAVADADYRQQKILELREHLGLTRWMATAVCIIAVAGTVIVGVSSGRWLNGFNASWGSALICLWTYTNTKTRLAALEAIDAKAGGRAPATGSDRTAAAAN